MTTVVEQLDLLDLLEELTEEQVECLEQYEDLEDIVECLDMDYRVYENDNEFLGGFEPVELARAICYGDYNVYHDYVRIDVYGNLESFTRYDYLEMLEDNAREIIEYALECNGLLY